VQHIEKSKVVPVHTMKAYSGSRCIAPYVIHLAEDGGKGSTTCPSCITLRKEPQHSLYMRLDGPRGKSGYFVEDKNLMTLPGFKLLTVQPQPTCYTKYAILVPNT